MLGLRRGASAEDVDAKYAELALRYHPDKTHDSDTTQWSMLCAAYALLSKLTATTAAHDASTTSRRDSVSRHAVINQPVIRGFDHTPQDDEDEEYIFNQPEPMDFNSTPMARGNPHRKRTMPQILYVHLTLEDLIHHTAQERTVEYEETVQCRCMEDDDVQCSKCDSKRRVAVGRTSVTLSIPRNVSDNMMLAAHGDTHLVARVHLPPGWTHRNNNLYITLQAECEEAVLGGPFYIFDGAPPFFTNTLINSRHSVSIPCSFFWNETAKGSVVYISFAAASLNRTLDHTRVRELLSKTQKNSANTF